MKCKKAKTKETKATAKSTGEETGQTVNGYALLYTIIDVKICYIYRVNTMR
jgi:hypothetical protein